MHNLNATLYLELNGQVVKGVAKTGSVKVECLPPERKAVSLSHSRVIPKT